MDRKAISSGLVVIALLLGGVSTCSFDPSSRGDSAAYKKTNIEMSDGRDLFLNEIESLGRWNIEGMQRAPQERAATGEFQEDYRLVAIVMSDNAYALIEPKHQDRDAANPGEVLTVRKGDSLDNGWVIVGIESTAVLAGREDEQQRIQLFPEA